MHRLHVAFHHNVLKRFVLSFQEREDAGLTDWDRFARAEYVRLALEEEGDAEDGDTKILDEPWCAHTEPVTPQAGWACIIHPSFALAVARLAIVWVAMFLSGVADFFLLCKAHQIWLLVVLLKVKVVLQSFSS